MYEPAYNTINSFRTKPFVTELLHQCFVKFRTQLFQVEVIDEEYNFMDVMKIEVNAN